MGTEANQHFYTSPGGKLKSVYGGVVPSVAGPLVLPADGLIFTVSGTAAITGITLPYEQFTGFIILIPSGVFTWTTATNIGLAGTAVVGKAIIFVFDGAKWWPTVTS